MSTKVSVYAIELAEILRYAQSQMSEKDLQKKKKNKVKSRILVRFYLAITLQKRQDKA